MATLAEFAYPGIYSFPPFYTLQPNLNTRDAQLSQWSSLILAYAAHHKLYRINSTHAIFTNTTLKRALAPTDARVLLAHMVSANLADPIDALSTLNTAAAITSSATGKQHKAHTKAEEAEVWLWWKTPEEWALLVMEWIERTGQKSSVLTFYELLEGDATEQEEFHGLPTEMMGRVVSVLVRRGKGAVLGEGEGLGVKIY